MIHIPIAITAGENYDADSHKSSSPTALLNHNRMTNLFYLQNRQNG
ncbi:hypothetical protein NUZ5A_50971 [Candidatus Nitrosotenuis uzonensis]|uniref:Uncharacterized protein n=1 Tax=Candidatus Nitrosotenuis uzonensis TaxID=1407055 RepID=A0A812F6E4_9ARCH|nr:hypothetical protein NUZ5A_50971 [Candidatus Nitrosotenuis uzonensis]